MSALTLSLFDDADVRPFDPPGDSLIVVAGDQNSLIGLSLYPKFITAGEERVLMWETDREGDWSTHWSRRTKSFGKSYVAAEDGKTGCHELPIWATFVRERLVQRAIMHKLPNQMGVNEYMPGQGIAPHVDYFGGTVVSLSLGSGCVMDFTIPGQEERTVSIWLPQRSIVVMKSEARNIWRHGIRGRKKDIVDGHAINRNRRISLTFRDVER